MTIPTEDEINVYSSLDEIVARDHFLNKSVDEGEALFRDNSAYYQEDLMWMGPKAFAFYLQSAVNYVKSEDAVDDDHVISSLFDVIAFRQPQQEFSLARKPVSELVSYVIEHYEKFNVDADIYGDLLTKYLGLKEQIDAMP